MHWWRIRVNASLFNHFSFLLFSSPISSFLPFAYSGFSFYALSCPSVVILFLFSLFIIFTKKKTNNFHPFNGYDGFSVPAQHHFPLFSKVLNTLYIDWRISLCHVIMERFSMKLPWLLPEKNGESGSHDKPVRYFLLKLDGTNMELPL